MNPEQEAQDFTSEHRTFAEKEGYRVAQALHGGWVIVTPRGLRPGEKVRIFKNLSMAWEVAAIRAGRKVVKAKAAEETRPAPIMQARYRGTKL